MSIELLPAVVKATPLYEREWPVAGLNSVITHNGDELRLGDYVTVEPGHGDSLPIGVIGRVCNLRQETDGYGRPTMISVWRSDGGTGGGVDGSWCVALSNEGLMPVNAPDRLFFPGMVGALQLRESDAPHYGWPNGNCEEAYRDKDLTVKVTRFRDGYLLCKPYRSSDPTETPMSMRIKVLPSEFKPHPIKKQTKQPKWGGTTKFPIKELNYLPVKSTEHELHKEFKDTLNEISLKNTSSDVTVDNILSVKEDTIKRLGLGTDLRRTITMPNNVDPVLPKRMRLYIAQCCEAKSVSYTLNPAEVQMKGGNMKLTKFLAKHASEPSIYAREELQQTLNSAKPIKDKQDYIARMGELLTVGEFQITLTCNPSDFVTSTFGGGFTSCYCPTGCYFNGNLSYALSPHCLMIYTGTPKKKTGRAWVMLGEDFEWIWMVKGYGIFPDQLRKMGRRALQVILSGNKHWILGKTSHAHQLITVVNGYRDNEGYDFAELRTARQLSEITTAKVLCLECGVETNHHKKGTCSDCSSDYTCTNCDCNLNEDDVMWMRDHTYCDTCFDEQFYRCYHCGDAYDPEVDGVEIDDGDVHTCSVSCANSYGWEECPECGEYGRSSYFEHGMCDNCVADLTPCGIETCDGLYHNGRCTDCNRLETDPVISCNVGDCDGEYVDGECNYCQHEEGTEVEPEGDETEVVAPAEPVTAEAVAEPEVEGEPDVLDSED